MPSMVVRDEIIRGEARVRRIIERLPMTPQWHTLAVALGLKLSLLFSVRHDKR